MASAVLCSLSMLAEALFDCVRHCSEEAISFVAYAVVCPFSRGSDWCSLYRQFGPVALPPTAVLTWLGIAFLLLACAAHVLFFRSGLEAAAAAIDVPPDVLLGSGMVGSAAPPAPASRARNSRRSHALDHEIRLLERVAGVDYSVARQRRHRRIATKEDAVT